MTDTSTATDERLTVSDVKREISEVNNAISTVIEGKKEAIQTTMIALLCGGHVLIEDVPGVGKTKLARALAGAIEGSFHRIQFTPDLLPSDLTGVSIYDQQHGEFSFKPGPIFSHIVVGDEINRASPKTQSALLEAMEEQQVTHDGQTYDLPNPFIVIATANPIEMEGTFPLPEAQRDRFMAQIEMGYPSRDAEMAMLDSHARDPLRALRPATSVSRIAQLAEVVRGVYVAEGIRRYVVDLAEYTRTHPAIRLGASPRASMQLLRAAKVVAALAERNFVIPDDVQNLVNVVWSHRLLMSGSTSREQSAETVIDSALRTVSIPRAEV